MWRGFDDLHSQVFDVFCHSLHLLIIFLCQNVIEIVDLGKQIWLRCCLLHYLESLYTLYYCCDAAIGHLYDFEDSAQCSYIEKIDYCGVFHLVVNLCYCPQNLSGLVCIPYQFYRLLSPYSDGNNGRREKYCISQCKYRKYFGKFLFIKVLDRIHIYYGKNVYISNTGIKQKVIFLHKICIVTLCQLKSVLNQ